ncbi:MAG: phosphoadenosine phosphosulfate reductase, partial [Proteobacteria bacterium]|nr:phosphoadenosine phosphosulfate reductase [Pseudomonadota bacterium]
GKDSTMALYVTVKELELRPLAVFIDNGFCTEAMYSNVRNATDKLGVDLVIYAPQLIKNLFKHLLLSKSRVYYCRICNALIDYYLRAIARQQGIPLLITGLTKGQEFLKGTELFWIYRASDSNLLRAIAGQPEFKLVADMFTSLALYFHQHFGSITQVSPFHYLAYEEQEILRVLTEELGYALPGISWPQGSTNCLFNFVSQSLTIEYFGYSQHEAEISALVRNNEMSRERALEIIETHISEKQVKLALAKLNLTCKDVF